MVFKATWRKRDIQHMCSYEHTCYQLFNLIVAVVAVALYPLYPVIGCNSLLSPAHTHTYNQTSQQRQYILHLSERHRKYAIFYGQKDGNNWFR